MSRPDWNERYAAATTPWDTGRPDPHLVALLPTLPGVQRVLEIGCGTGTNAVWMAEQGLDVTAIDLAPLALDRARARAEAAGVHVHFARVDILHEAPPGHGYHLVYDRGCLHVFDLAADRARFAAQVAAHLADGGLWVCIAGSTEGPARDTGPPRRSARDLVEAIEPHLELVSLEAVRFSAEEPHAAAAWRCLSRRRSVPAQPSTVR